MTAQKNAEIKVTGDAKNNTTSTIITYIKQSHCLFRLYMLKYRLFDNFLRQTDIALGFFLLPLRGISEIKAVITYV